jgi:hypothetical protein
MAPTVSMTWNWKWSLAATGATAMAGWLASPPLEPADGAARRGAAIGRRTSDVGPAAVAEIQEQARRLTSRLASRPGERSAGAQSVPVRHAAGGPACARRHRARGRASGRGRASAVPAAPAGVAVDTVDGVDTRTAIISGPAGIELAKAGQPAAPGYRVVTVGEAFAEVERLSDGVRERLILGNPSVMWEPASAGPGT